MTTLIAPRRGEAIVERDGQPTRRMIEYMELNSTLINQGTDSNTYTPTATNIANVSVFTEHLTQYYKVGIMVTVFGSINVDPNATDSYTEFRIDLPIASTLSNVYELAGTGSWGYQANSTHQKVGIFANTANNEAEFNFYTPLNADAKELTFSFSYQIID